MRSIKFILTLVTLLLLNGCIVQFIPDINEEQSFLVIEGMVTNLNQRYTVKMSRSVAVGAREKPLPVTNSFVSVTDDENNRYLLSEKKPGIYQTDSLTFRGVIGRKYTLHIQSLGLNYESTPMEMKPVPPIDSVYFEKETRESQNSFLPVNGCQIYLNTFDQTNSCKYYRWEYVETWKFVLPYPVVNNTCWISSNSSNIYIKNTSVLREDRVTKYPLQFVSDETDRLLERYSLLVNQYSVSEEEYTYWEKLQKVSESVGGLYDVTPMTIQSNIECIEDPNEKVLGYFSVSAVSSKRIYIDGFRGNFIDFYSECPVDTLPASANISDIWILNRLPELVITNKLGCADCTVRGTKVKPDFWIEQYE